MYVSDFQSNLISSQSIEINNPLTVVFILSSPRSGSTWLNLVLGSCSWAMNLGEYNRPWTNAAPVVCRLCQSHGLSECTVLHGYEKIDRKEAFRFAASRSKKNVLIDCSKDISWCSIFIDQEHVDCRFIHLLRHPCGFLESQQRRVPDQSFTALIAEWESHNRSISNFLEKVNAPATAVSYDMLADNPNENFPQLCNFLGRSWEKEALDYWKFTHHGLGGNGAASVYLRGHKSQPFLTGDDHFYQDITTRPTRSDIRFRDRLPLEIRKYVLNQPYVKAWNDKFGGIWCL